MSTPAGQGLDPMLVAELYHSAAELETLYGLLVIKNGYLIAEGYFNEGAIDRKNQLQSATKSVTSALVGIALDQGCLSSVDQKMMDFFPEFAGQIDDPRKEQITIRDMLLMRAGYPDEETDPALFEALLSGNYGQSDKAPGDVSLGIQNQVLDMLLDDWQPSEPGIIGHDFGGAILFGTHPINGYDFLRFVLMDAVAVSPRGSPFFRRVQAHETAFAGTPDDIRHAIVRAYVKTAAFKPIDDAALDMSLALWTGDDGKAARSQQIAQADSAYTDEAQTLDAQMSRPVLILWGREDAWIPLEQGEALHDMIPGSEFHVIPDAGHLVIEEQPDRLAEKIRSFLQTKDIT